MSNTEIPIRYLDKSLAASFALWNALLTINGVLLSVISVLAVVVPSISLAPALLLIVLCSVSLLLLAWNFVAVRRYYLMLGRKVAPGNVEVPDQEAAADLKAAHRAHALMTAREVSTLVLLVIEVGSVAWLIGTSQ